MPRARTTVGPPSPTPAGVAIRLLGGFAVTIAGQEVAERAWGSSRKARALIKLLALAPGQRLHRDQILDALWPDFDPDAADRAFHQSLYLARRAIDPGRTGLLALRQEVVALTPGGSATVDLAAFTAAAERARATRTVADLEAALARYTGEVLPGDRYEEWAIGPREAARATHLALLRDLAGALEASGDREGAIGALDRLVAAEPTDEAAHAALMRLHAQGGQRAQALAQFRHLREVLRRELDVEPDVTTQRLYAALLARRASPDETPPDTTAQTSTAAHHNLPAATTTLFGREAAIDEVCATLATARLVTLVGAGGCGKTRLALAVGQELAEAGTTFPDGIWWADLAPLADEGVLASTVARALGVRERPGQALTETLVAALRERTLLLILDNCEHLVAACADLAAALLAGCPNLRVLATSREALRVPGELTWRVPSLPVPSTDLPSEPPPAVFTENAAVQLFLDRARFARPGFALAGEDAGAVAAICRRLDGIPLAIELAAARVAVLTPPQLAARLDNALRLLTGGPRTALPRHRTLRATLDWSFQLLDGDGQALLARLAVFIGGFTLPAAEAACGLGESTLDVLAGLVEQSLVQVEMPVTNDGVRYRLLETVRQFAAEQLAAAEADIAGERHAHYFMALAEEAGAHYRTAAQFDWDRILDSELDNLRSALQWSLTRGEADVGLRLASALHWYWYQHTLFQEGWRWQTQLLALPDTGVSPSVRARGLASAAHLIFYRGEIAETRQLAMRALALCDAGTGDAATRIQALTGLGHAALGSRELAEARTWYNDALALARQSERPELLCWALNNLANIAFTTGDFALAAANAEEGAPYARRAGDAISLMYGAIVLGNSRNALGDAARAATAVREGLQVSSRTENWYYTYQLIEVARRLATTIGRDEDAARFSGVLASVRQRQRMVFPQFYIDLGVAEVAEIRGRLGDAAYAALAAEGNAWTFDAALARIFAFLDGILAPPADAAGEAGA